METYELKQIYLKTIHNIHKLKTMGFSPGNLGVDSNTSQIYETCEYIVDNFPPEDWDYIVDKIFTSAINSQNIFSDLDEIFRGSRSNI